MIEVGFKMEPGAKVPRNAYGNDAGWDLFTLEDAIIPPVATLVTIRTGISIALPEGYYARIVGRSSTFTAGLMVTEGIIDAGFRGELLVRVFPLLPKLDSTLRAVSRTIEAGRSIAQLIVQEVRPVVWQQYQELPESLRGENGFGSSGD